MLETATPAKIQAIMQRPGRSMRVFVPWLESQGTILRFTTTVGVKFLAEVIDPYTKTLHLHRLSKYLGQIQMRDSVIIHGTIRFTGVVDHVEPIYGPIETIEIL